MKNHVRVSLAAALLSLNGPAVAQEDLAPEAPEDTPLGDETTPEPATAEEAAEAPAEDAVAEAPEEAEPVEPAPVEPAPVEPAPRAATPPPQVVPRLRPTPPPPHSGSQPAPSSAAPRTAPPPSSTQPSSTPPPAAEEKEEESSGGGLYFDADLAGTYGIRSTHEWNDVCPEVIVESDPSMNWSPSCNATTPLGIAMEGRIGVRIGVVGIEGFGLGALDWSSGELGGEKPAVELPGFASNMQIGRVGGGVGGGLRLMSNGFLRVSTGIGGGIMFRHVYSNVSSLDGSSTGYTAPILKADLSLTLGKFLNLGLLGWVEFSPEVKVTPNLSAAGALAGVDPNDPNVPPETRAMLEAFENSLGDVTVFDGTQFFIGPYLGLHFGK